MLTDSNTGKYRVGQIWKFKSRPGEDGATLTVVRVESSKVLGVIVHVSVQGVRIKNPSAPGGFSDTLQHGPFSEEAIAKSVTTLVGETKTLPAYTKRATARGAKHLTRARPASSPSPSPRLSGSWSRP